MNRRYATYQEKRKLEDIVLSNSDPVGENSVEREWHEGWDFRRVAQAANDFLGLKGGENFDLNTGHVRHLVKDLGIVMHENKPGNKKSKLEARVAALERDIQEILNRLDAAGA